MNFTLKVWRQARLQVGREVCSPTKCRNVTKDMSFLEMLDLLNENLQNQGEAPVTFEHDCREGILRGSCGFLDQRRCARGTSRHDGVPAFDAFLQGWRFVNPRAMARERAVSVLRDSVRRPLAVRQDYSGWRLHHTAPTGGAPDANAILVPKESSERAFDAAACIGCGACVAACPNAAAMLFTAAKITHLNSLPQGQLQRERAYAWICPVAAMSEEVFGSCTLITASVRPVCPKKIPIEFIGRMNRDLIHATLHHRGK